MISFNKDTDLCSILVVFPFLQIYIYYSPSYTSHVRWVRAGSIMAASARNNSHDSRHFLKQRCDSVYSLVHLVPLAHYCFSAIPVSGMPRVRHTKCSILAQVYPAATIPQSRWNLTTVDMSDDMSSESMMRNEGWHQ
jgi:hypothetical protein